MGSLLRREFNKPKITLRGCKFVLVTHLTDKVLWEIDMLTGREKELAISEFPTPEELWERTYESEDEWRDRFSEVPFEDRGGTWTPRYYQDNAVEAALKAIGDGKDRILLTLATGTGKTSIAFQIAWKLFQTRWNRSEGVSRRPRILFLADRNILADQAKNSFSPFGEHAMERITPEDIRKKGLVPKNANIFFTIFQTFMSGPDDSPFFGEYPKDFFDMIIVDECHRGGQMMRVNGGDSGILLSCCTTRFDSYSQA